MHYQLYTAPILVILLDVSLRSPVRVFRSSVCYPCIKAPVLMQFRHIYNSPRFRYHRVHRGVFVTLIMGEKCQPICCHADRERERERERAWRLTPLKYPIRIMARDRLGAPVSPIHLTLRSYLQIEQV